MTVMTRCEALQSMGINLRRFSQLSADQLNEYVDVREVGAVDFDKHHDETTDEEILTRRDPATGEFEFLNAKTVCESLGDYCERLHQVVGEVSGAELEYLSDCLNGAADMVRNGDLFCNAITEIEDVGESLIAHLNLIEAVHDGPKVPGDGERLETRNALGVLAQRLNEILRGLRSPIVVDSNGDAPHS